MQLRSSWLLLAASGIAVCPTLGGHTVESLAPASQRIQQALGAGVTPEVFIEMRMSILRRMTAFGVRLISGTDAGIARIKAHGNYADAVIELGQLTGTLPALLAASSSAAGAIGLGRSKGRLRRGYDADILVVEGDLAADLTTLRHVQQVVLRGAGLATAGAVLKRLDRSLHPGAQAVGHQDPVGLGTKDEARISGALARWRPSRRAPGPVADGAASMVWAATIPDGGPSGGLFRDGQPLAGYAAAQLSCRMPPLCGLLAEVPGWEGSPSPRAHRRGFALPPTSLARPGTCA
jgi:hypothetical protein